MNDELMTPDDVRDLLKVTKDWLYDQVQARRIPYIRLGRHLRFRHAEVLAYIGANSVGQDGGGVSHPAPGR
jgi:excisionase family DNA binding protein